MNLIKRLFPGRKHHFPRGIPGLSKRFLALSILLGLIGIFTAFYFASASWYGNRDEIQWYPNGNMQARGRMVNDAQDGKWSYWTEEGNLSLIAHYEHGLEDGKWTWFNDQKHVMQKGAYREGLPHGTWTFYYHNRQMSRELTYSHEVKNGRFQTWYPNGQRMEYGAYQEDLKEGVWQRWYENGQLQSEGHFHENRKIGVWKFWNRNGVLNRELIIQDDDYQIVNANYPNGSRMVVAGDGYFREYNPYSVVMSEGRVHHQKKIGNWTFYYQNGTPKMRGHYRSGTFFLHEAWLPDGKVTATNGNGVVVDFYPESQIRSKIYYKSGLKNGYGFRWYEDASIEEESYYQKGTYHGPYKRWHANRELSLYGQYQHGRKTGIWMSFYESGTRKAANSYNQGEKHGPQHHWLENGELLKQELFSDGKLLQEKSLSDEGEDIVLRY